ncbi:MAG TPA: xylulokinase [Thermotogota bacterium]|nr:xylulokinase [Thermotogota bacterium]HRW34714.1 xylulokinase [Thermotogota bacterium]
MFLGIDVGTTGIKALVVNDKGKVLNQYNRPLELDVPKPGWAQQDPDDWLKAVLAMLKEVSKKHKIKAISFSGQMHSLVMLDKEDQVLRKAILWCDQRTTAQCKQATNIIGGEQSVIGLIANPILEGFTLGKILWVKENEPDVFKKIKKIMMPKDYICMKLGGDYGTDFSDASGTAYFNVHDSRWSHEILGKLAIDPSILPPVFESHSFRGKLREDLTKELGWKDTLIVSGGADNAVAAYGIGISKPGDTMVSIGTSGTVLTATEKGAPDFDGKIHFFHHVLPDQKYYMGVMLSAAHSLNWFLKAFNIRWTFEELENKISKVKPGVGGLLFLPYLNGERTPLRDPNARGVLFGLSSKTTAEEVIRAVIEGVTFGLRDSFELIKDKTEVKTIRAVGGGAKNKVWCSIIADNFKMPVSVPENDEGGAYGAAMLAAKGAGIKEEELSTWVKIKETIQPNPENYAIYDKLYEQFKGLYTDLKERFTEITKITE